MYNTCIVGVCRLYCHDVFSYLYLLIAADLKSLLRWNQLLALASMFY